MLSFSVDGGLLVTVWEIYITIRWELFTYKGISHVIHNGRHFRGGFFVNFVDDENVEL